MKNCRFCGEEIKESAIKCRVCGEWLIPRRTILARVLEWTVDKGRGALALAALLIYAFVRVAHDAFYQRFAVTPEAVGLTQATIIGRATLYFTLFLAALLAIEGAWVTFWFAWTWGTKWFGGAKRVGQGVKKTILVTPHDEPDHTWIPVSVVYFVLLIPLALFILAPEVFHYLRSSILGVFTGILALALHAFIGWRLIDFITGPAGSLPREAPTFVRTGLVTVVAVLMVFSFLLVSQRGQQLANQVVNGAPKGPSGFGLLSISADPVCINLMSEAKVQLPTRPFMYLGSANGFLVLYDYRTAYRRPIRIPTGNAILTIADPGPPGPRGRQWRCPQEVSRSCLHRVLVSAPRASR